MTEGAVLGKASPRSLLLKDGMDINSLLIPGHGELHNGAYWRVSEEEVSQSKLFPVQPGLCFLQLGGCDLPSILVLQESQPGAGANVSVVTSWQEACSNKQLFWEEEVKKNKSWQEMLQGLHFRQMFVSAPWAPQTWLCHPGSCSLCSAMPPPHPSQGTPAHPQSFLNLLLRLSTA